MVVCLFAVVWTVAESFDAVIPGRAPEETMRERLVPFLVPLEVSNHFLLLHEDPRIARVRVTVKVFPIRELLAQSSAALGRVAVPGDREDH